MTARASVAMPDVAGRGSIDAWTRPTVAPEVVYQTMPPLDAEKYAELEASILEHGVQVPVLVDENGAIIDGHHRREIATRLEVEFPVEVRAGLTEAEKISLSMSLNIVRRQLTREQTREIIASSIRADPAASDNSIAKRLGVHNETVAAARKRLVEAGDVTESVTRRDALGRQQPATKPATVTVLDQQTGELADVPIVTETHTIERTTLATAERPRVDPIERAVADIEAIALRVADLPAADLAADRAEDWGRRLSVSILTLRAFAHLIEGSTA